MEKNLCITNPPFNEQIWPVPSDFIKSRFHCITKKELALHCRRQTRGTAETARLIKELIDVFSSDKGRDTMGIPLLNRDRIEQIWNVEKHHSRP